ncbi:hypothetical protein C1646_756243 [Rhizophagus diaphanus]|nr:hypothetical protein C1646_756243 [Rhizophagus diaphanus] [Rhizophagus sp. MUCL 43196]
MRSQFEMKVLDTKNVEIKEIFSTTIQDSPLSQSSGTRPLSNMMSERFILTSPSCQEKKKSNKDDASTTLKKLIEELSTNIPDSGEVLKKSNTSDALPNIGKFLHLSDMIDQAEAKNEDATRNVINRLEKLCICDTRN